MNPYYIAPKIKPRSFKRGSHSFRAIRLQIFAFPSLRLTHYPRRFARGPREISKKFPGLVPRTPNDFAGRQSRELRTTSRGDSPANSERLRGIIRTIIFSALELEKIMCSLEVYRHAGLQGIGKTVVLAVKKAAGNEPGAGHLHLYVLGVVVGRKAVDLAADIA